VGITCGGLDLEHTLLDRQQGHVEGAAAQIVDQNVALALRHVLLVEAVGDRRRRRLVDDAQHVQAGDGTGVFRRLTLAIVEIGGHGDHRVVHRMTQIVLRRLLHLGQHLGRNLLGREPLHLALVGDLDIGLALVGDHLERPVLHVLLHLRVEELATDEALRIEHCVSRIHRRLVVCCVAHQEVSFGECDIRRRRSVPLVIGDNLDGVVLPHPDTRIGRPQVNSNRVGRHLVERIRGSPLFLF
jgi:hypothetical protein